MNKKTYSIDKIYNYTDQDGNILYQSVRYIPKFFRQRRITTSNTYIWGVSAGDYRLGNDGHYYRKSSKDLPGTQYIRIPGIKQRVPYHLRQMIDKNFVILVEGEKDVHSLEYIGFTATTNSGGVGNFSKELAPFFHDKYVAIIGDNDEAGQRGVLQRAKILSPYTQAIKIIPALPETQEHEDTTDWIIQQSKKYITHTKKHLYNTLYKIIQETPLWSEHSPKYNVIPKNTTQEREKNIHSIHDFLLLLQNTIQTTDNHWQAQCPSHQDDTNSLSITKKENKILLYCFAGCKTSTILNTMKLSWKDLFV